MTSSFSCRTDRWMCRLLAHDDVAQPLPVLKAEELVDLGLPHVRVDEQDGFPGVGDDEREVGRDKGFAFLRDKARDEDRSAEGCRERRKARPCAGCETPPRRSISAYGAR